MNAQDVTEIKKLLEGIRSSFALNFWHELILIGFGFIPALILAILANKKDLKMFLANKEKEDERIKGQLVGKISAAGYKLSVSIMENMDACYIYNYKQQVIELAGADKTHIDDVVKEPLAVLEKTLDTCTKNTFAAKIEFLKLLGEFRYYVSDAELTKSINAYRSEKLVYPETFLGMKEKDFKQLDFETERNNRVAACLEKPLACIDTIVNYISDKKL